MSPPLRRVARVAVVSCAQPGAPLGALFSIHLAHETPAVGADWGIGVGQAAAAGRKGRGVAQVAGVREGVPVAAARLAHHLHLLLLEERLLAFVAIRGYHRAADVLLVRRAISSDGEYREQ